MKKKYVSALMALVMAIPLMAMPSLAFAQTKAADKVGNESFQKNLEAYPGLWDAEKGVTQPVFQYNNRILEQVFVEVPVDADEDGQRDLIKVYIYRPGESKAEGVTVPVLLHQSPYVSGYGPSTYLDHVVEQSDDTPITANYTYNDVKTKQVQAWDWPWTDDAFVVDDAVHGKISIPASRGDKPNPNNVTGSAFSENPSSAPANNNWKGYLNTRGYAYAIAGHLGTRYSDGIPSTCDVDEAVALMAVIKWFAGEGRAYADRAATTQVSATDWCNGNVAMEGTSYPGTTPLLAAGTGVRNLKAIFPKAPVSSWYNYYRDNGAVHNPDKYAGEDALKHAEYNFSRYSYTTQTIRDLANKKFDSMLERSDRDTGSYNEFWDQRNLLKNLDRLQKGREDDPIGVILQHGFNDHNVRTRMTDQLYRAIKAKAPLAPVKVYWHLNIHTDMQVYGGLLEWTHKWLDHFLYGIDNKVVEKMPEVTISNNTTGEFETFDSWPIPGSEYQKIYFKPAAEGSGAGTFALNPPTGNPAETFADDLVDYSKNANQKNGNAYQAYVAGWERRALLSWDGTKPNLNAVNTNRLAYISEPLTENLRLNGVAKITLNLTPDKAKGNISAAIVEIGTNNRPFAYGDSSGSAITLDGRTYPALTAGSAYANGTANPLPMGGGLSTNVTTYLNSSLNNTMSEYKFIARGHANVRKPNPSGKIYTDAAKTNFIPEYYYQEQDIVPGQPYSYTFEFDAQDYTFKAGQQLAVIVFSTDYRHSNIPGDVTSFTMDLSKSFIEIPFVSNTLKDVGVDVKLTIDSENIKAGDTVKVDAALTKQVTGNVAVLDFVYDKDKFDFDSVSLPIGSMQVISEELVLSDATKAGRRVVVMVQDYQMLDLATIALKAKTDIDESTGNIIEVGVKIVQKDAEETKDVLTLGSVLPYDPIIEIDDVDLLILSDAIDAYGKNTFSHDWILVRKYDVNKNGRIDIQDISDLARRIVLE